MICVACGTSGIRTVSALRDHGCPTREDWARVAALRREGEDEKAARLARRLLGIRGEPMDEETKEKLRQWKADHAQEIKARQVLEQQTRERLLALTAPSKGPLRRKV